MKKLVSISILLVCALFIFASATKDGGGTKIPDRILKIADKSCVKCHTEPGNGMALAHLNLSSWDKYSAEKQGAKAKAMCNMVSKDKMPPKSFREKHPEGVPSTEEIKTICDWAGTIEVSKK
jgi:hypothetical protein